MSWPLRPIDDGLISLTQSSEKPSLGWWPRIVAEIHAPICYACAQIPNCATHLKITAAGSSPKGGHDAHQSCVLTFKYIWAASGHANLGLKRRNVSNAMHSPTIWYDLARAAGHYSLYFGPPGTSTPLDLPRSLHPACSENELILELKVVFAFVANIPCVPLSFA
jgi:hypothetical protein